MIFFVGNYGEVLAITIVLTISDKPETSKLFVRDFAYLLIHLFKILFILIKKKQFINNVVLFVGNWGEKFLDYADSCLGE